MDLFNHKKIQNLAPDADNSLNKETKKGGLSVQRVGDYLRFTVFVSFIGMVYIWNVHYAEKQVRERDKLKTEVKSLKAEYIMKKAELSSGTRYTELVVRLDTLGLHRLEEPPYKLVKKKSPK